jgi:hypothetical protein
MNMWLGRKLHGRQSHTAATAAGLLADNSHFTPQTDFLLAHPFQVRIVDHVLRMDDDDDRN